MKLRIFLTLLLLPAFVPVFQGCDHQEAEIPAYLRIDTIPLDSTNYDSTGAVSHQIRYAWVYIEDNLQGVYKLPALFPVLNDGDLNFRIFAGVNENGISTAAMHYMYYASWDTTQKISGGDTTVLSPHVRYLKGYRVPWIENFNTTVSTKLEKASGSGSFSISVSPGVAQEGTGAGVMYLPEGGEELIVESQPIEIPTGKAGYFVELDYRNNCNFLFGLRSVNSSEGSSFIGIRPRDHWNKLYINVTNLVDKLSAQGTMYRMFFIVPQDTAVYEQTVLIDNLKLLY